MPILSQQLQDARAQFDAAIEAGKQAFSASHPFRDFVRQEGLELYRETLMSIFAADYAPIVASADTVVQKIRNCEAVFASHKAAYEAVFTDSANREISMTASVKGLHAAFKTILKR